MNNVNLIGRLVADPEMRVTNGGTSVANMRIAVDKRLAKEKKAEFEAAGKPTADFINVVTFGPQAEVMAKYVTKGKLIGVSGRLETGSYDAQDGSKRYTTDVISNSVDILEWPDNPNNESSSQDSSDFGGVEGFHPADLDDIPF